MQRFALIVDDSVHEVVEIPDDADIADHFHPSMHFEPAGPSVAVGWFWNGETFSAPVPVSLTIDDYRLAIQSHIDATAGQRSYDSGITCASYVGSTNPIWAAEAAAFTAWRDAVWTHAYVELAKVEGGQRPQPAVETILAELPALTWPN